MSVSSCLVVVAALAFMCGPGASPAWSSAADSLPARWERAMRDLRIPGMAVVVVRDTGIVLIETLGYRDLERRLPVTPATRFYIASCTKPFVATAAALLANDGHLDLGRPVRDYLPSFALADRGLSDSISVRDLLCHRFGLGSQPITRGEAYTGQMTEERFYRLLARVKPDREFSYGNLHYTITGRVIAAVSGRSWKQILQDRLFVPTGMTRATCSASALMADRDAAQPYEFVGDRIVRCELRKSDATMHAAGGMAASPLDLARWLRLELGDGILDGRRVLPASVLRATREPLARDAAEDHPLITEQRRLAWGAGWEVRELRGDTLYSHNGQFAGAAACFSYLPARNLGVAVVANGSGPAAFLAELVVQEAYDAILGAPAEDRLPKLMAFAAQAESHDEAGAARGRITLAADRYVGRYTNDDWGTLEVSARGDALHARIGALPLSLVFTGDDRFVAAGDYPGRFEIDASGRVRAVWVGMAPPDSARFARR